MTLADFATRDTATSVRDPSNAEGRPLSPSLTPERSVNSHLTDSGAPKMDRCTNFSTNKIPAPNSREAGYQQDGTKSLPSFSSTAQNLVSTLQLASNSFANPGYFDASKTLFLQPLPSFSALEYSIKCRRSAEGARSKDSQILKRGGCSFPNPPHAKRGKVQISAKPSIKTEQQKMKELNQSFGQKGANTKKSESYQDSLPKSPQIPFTVIRLKDIINPVTESALIMKNEPANPDTSDNDPISSTAGPSLSQTQSGTHIFHDTPFPSKEKASQRSHQRQYNLSRPNWPQSHPGRHTTGMTPCINQNELPGIYQNVDSRDPGIPEQYHSPITTPFLQGSRHEKYSCDGASRNGYCFHPNQSVSPQLVQTARDPIDIPPAVLCENLSHVQKPNDTRGADLIRFYDLGKIERLGCKVVNGRVYNEHNLPICAAPRENGIPCRRNISNSACNWHGKFVLLTSRNTKNGHLHASGNCLPTGSVQQKQRSAVKPLQNCLQNQHEDIIRFPQALQIQSQGLRWDNEEHFWFLLGYEKLGKKWSKISKVIKTRTALQTQSHAQKYFERMKTVYKKKCTIHDLSLESPEMRTIAACISEEEKENRLARGQCAPSK